MSYIIPAYNAGVYISDALESCLKQDYRPLEILVVDDGSTDTTAEIIKNCAVQRGEGEFRIIYLFQKNSGPSVARNCGLVNSQGDIIGFLDSDDILPETRTSLLVEGLTKCDADVTYGNYRKFVCTKRGDFEFLQETINSPDLASSQEWREMSSSPPIRFVPAPCNCLMRRELAEKTGPFSNNCTYSEDFEYVVRLRLQSPRIMKTNTVVYFYRKTPGSITSTFAQKNARDMLHSTKSILNHIVRFDATDADSLVRLRRRFLRTALECLRYGLRNETVEAFHLAAEVTSGRMRVFYLSASHFCKNPTFVSFLRWLIGVRKAFKEWFNGCVNRAMQKK